MNNKRILIADDEEDIVETIKFGLEQEGFEVLTANDGFEAFALTGIEKPDMVILDVMMPKENGYRVSSAIKDSIAVGLYGKNIKVLLLTARVLNESEREKMFMNMSQADYMMYKPFEMEDLLEKINELLGETVSKE